MTALIAQLCSLGAGPSERTEIGAVKCERFEDGIVNMTAHVAKSAGAEIEAFAPVARMIVSRGHERAFLRTRRAIDPN